MLGLLLKRQLSSIAVKNCYKPAFRDTWVGKTPCPLPPDPLTHFPPLSPPITCPLTFRHFADVSFQDPEMLRGSLQLCTSKLFSKLLF